MLVCCDARFLLTVSSHAICEHHWTVILICIILSMYNVRRRRRATYRGHRSACAPHTPLPVLSPLRTNSHTLFTNCCDWRDSRSVGHTDVARLRPFFIRQSLVGRDDRDINRRVMTLWRDSMSKADTSAEAALSSVAVHVDQYIEPDEEHSKLLEPQSLTPTVTPSGQIRKVKSFTDTHKIRDVSTASGAASARCLRPYEQVTPYPEGSESGTNQYGAPSVRSLASIGMGCTDGRKMVIRRVPTSPTELFHLVRPPTWVVARILHITRCYYYSIVLTNKCLPRILNQTLVQDKYYCTVSHVDHVLPPF